MPEHKRVNGFIPPPGCSKQLTNQVQQVIDRHNQCVLDYNAYRQALVESQRNYRILQKKYQELNEASVKLAEKYEKITRLNESAKH